MRSLKFWTAAPMSRVKPRDLMQWWNRQKSVRQRSVSVFSDWRVKRKSSRPFWLQPGNSMMRLHPRLKMPMRNVNIWIWVWWRFRKSWRNRTQSWKQNRQPITERHPGWILSEISRSVMMDTETVSGELWNKKNVFRESRVLSQIWSR